MKTIDKIWREKKFTLDKLYLDVKWLISMDMPDGRKHAIWHYKFDKFVLMSFDQDKRIREIIEP